MQAMAPTRRSDVAVGERKPTSPRRPMDDRGPRSSGAAPARFEGEVKAIFPRAVVARGEGGLVVRRQTVPARRRRDGRLPHGEGRMGHVASLIALKEEMYQRLMRVTPRCPRDKLAWAPEPGALTLGQLLRHLHRSELNRMKLMRGLIDVAAYYRLRHGETDLRTHLGEVRDLDAELEALRAAHAYTLETLRGMDDADLTATVQWSKGPRTKLEFILLMLEHEAHHRGQIATYLRILGVPGTQPYGP